MPALLLPPRAWSDPRRRFRWAPPPVRTPDEPPAAGRAMGGAGVGAPASPLLLIVDDDSLMTTLLPRTLRRAFGPDLRIATATTPEEAARVMRELRPDIVLSDYNLRAAKTGLDVLADAAGVVPEGVRILFSGHSRSEIGEALDGVPIHGFLEKPFRLDELLDPFADLVQQAAGIDLRSAES